MKKQKKIRIQIKVYPESMSFDVFLKLPKWDDSQPGCGVRDLILHDYLDAVGFESPYHDTSNYAVEYVKKTKTGEIWEIGS